MSIWATGSRTVFDSHFRLNAPAAYHFTWSFAGDNFDAQNHATLVGLFGPLGDLLAIGNSGEASGILPVGSYPLDAEAYILNSGYPDKVSASFSINLELSPVPEPAAALLLALGGALMARWGQLSPVGLKPVVQLLLPDRVERGFDSLGRDVRGCESAPV